MVARRFPKAKVASSILVGGSFFFLFASRTDGMGMGGARPLNYRIVRRENWEVHLMDNGIVVQGDLGANEYVFAVPEFEVEQAKYLESI